MSNPKEFSFTTALSACGTGGQYEKALELFDEMKKLGMRREEVTFYAAIAAREVAGETNRAMDLYLEAASRSFYGRVRRSEYVLDLRELLSVSLSRTSVRVTLLDVRRLIREYDGPSADSPDGSTIIVGRGSHREDGVSILEPAIVEMFQEEYAGQLECIEDNDINEGRLHVSADSFRKWMLSAVAS